ncbi:MAG: hypothetical protein JRI23_21770, partial [Deltaproteobacteria bacterium]|nr:hypothetical protein [Deltaproteobacteria bacterium]MBW2534578.1 hypothetical protein [Deltaproteobacteria bacterium]
MRRPFDPTATPLADRLLAAARQGDSSGPTEDSALFTLDRLMAGAADGTSAEDRDEDSGLIDLRALARGVAAVPEAVEPTSWAAPAHFPLGDPSARAPVAAPAPAVPVPQPSRRLPVYGLAATAIVLAAAVVFLLVRSGQTAPAAAERPSGPGP